MIAITRSDRAYMRKWTKAHSKGMPTAEITREWLRGVAGPKSHSRPDAAGITETIIETEWGPQVLYAYARK